MELGYTNWRLTKDMWRFLKPHRVRFFLATFIRIIADLAWLYPAYGLASLVNFLTVYEPGTDLQPVLVIFSLFVLASILRFGGGYITKMYMFTISERMDLDSQMSVMSHMFDVDIAWHEKENTGNKLKKIVRGSDSIDKILRIWINNILPIGINIIGITFVIARFTPVIAALTCLFLITYYVFAHLMRKKAVGASALVNKQEEDLEGVLFESLNNIRTVKVLGMAHALKEIISRTSEELYEKKLGRIFWFQVGAYSRGFYAQLFQICVLAYIVWGITQGQYQIGFLVLFSTYFGSLLQSVGELADISQEVVVARLSIGRMLEMFEAPTAIDSTEGKVSFPQDWKKISFKNVSFGYGDVEILHDISFDIHRGEKVGIIGLSGAGKSTLFKLLLKEHESYEGEILIDEVPLSEISRQDYFNYSAVVLQDTEVFNLSLRENIVLANNRESENSALLERAINVAHVEDVIARLPNGEDTLIGEKGVRLSGGERQRIGIARAVFKSPQLLLLDEATSHLDIESEGKIQSSLHEFFQTVTAVVIAHRLTTIKEMDRIIVVEDGRILEEGSFEELHKKQGRFHELWEKQSL